MISRPKIQGELAGISGNKTHEKKEVSGGGAEAALATMQGKRKDQEDSHIVNAKLDNKEWYVSAVFDGHGGSETSRFLEENFINELNSKITTRTTESSLKKILALFYKDLDNKIKSIANISGSTAIVVILTPTKIVVVNLGDSRAIGIKDGAIVWKTEDHDPLFNEVEQARITAAGYSYDKLYGHLDKGCGINVSRAFGDNRCKSYEKAGVPASPDKQPVSVIPDIEIHERNTVDHIVITCDGVWDVIKPTLAREEVATWVNTNKALSAQEIADDLIDNAIILGSGDNISAIVIKVTPPADTETTASPGDAKAAADAARAARAAARAAKGGSRRLRAKPKNRTLKLRFIY